MSIGKITAIKCGIVVLTPSTYDPNIGEIYATECGTVVQVYEDNNNLKKLLDEVENLKLNNEDEESCSKAARLIEQQLLPASSTSTETFLKALSEIGKGTVSASLGTVIASFF